MFIDILLCLVIIFHIVQQVQLVEIELKNTCEDVVTNDYEITKFLKRNVKANYWDRPVVDSKRAIDVVLKLAISTFPVIVSYFFL